MESKMDERYEQGKAHGYHMGEMERIALATANTDLRSQVRELQEANRRLRLTLADQT